MPLRGGHNWAGKYLHLRALAVILIALLVISASAPVRAGSASAPAIGETSSFDEGDLSQVSEPNNSTVLHENPQNADEDGDTQQLQSHLVSVLTQRLGQSAVQLNQSQYQQAQSLLGSQYTDALEKFVDVAGDAGNGEETANELKRTQNRQQRLTNATQRYRQTYQEYQEARENGETQRARELARQLDNIATTVRQRERTLQDSYTQIENGTDVDLSRASSTVQQIQQNISERQETVLEVEFIETEITASTQSEVASFDNPAQIIGVLRTANGTPITNREVTVQVGNQTIETTTGITGSYSVAYRPTTVPATSTNVSVRYLPDDQSRYLPANTSLPLNVQSVNGTLEITRMPEETAYNQSIAVTGLFTVNGTPVGGVPVEVTLGGVSLGIVETNSAGGFLLETTVPASVPVGQQSLQVQMPTERPALGAAPASQSVSVNPTATTLTTTAQRVGGQTIQISGRLHTADGTPVPSQPVTIQFPGPAQTQVTTTATGRYQTTVSVPDESIQNNQVTITAVFAGSSSSLERSEAQTTVTLPTSTTGTETQHSLLPVNWRYLAVGVGVMVLSLLGAWYLLRDPSDSPPTETATSSGTAGDDSEDVEFAMTSLIVSARKRLQAGQTDDAIRSAYAAVRRWGEELHGITGIRTHWEFYQATSDQRSSDERDALKGLTESYERAAFDSQQTSEEEADDAVSAANELVNNREE